jgi:hypothetical protein
MGTCLPGHQGVSPRMTSQEIARAMEVTLRYLWTDDLDSPMFELVPPVRQYLRFTIREPPTGQSDPPIGQLEARIRVGRPIHLLLLAN